MPRDRLDSGEWTWYQKAEHNVLRIGALVVLAASLSGCAYPTHDPYVAKVEEEIEHVRPGETTREDVKERLGVPRIGTGEAYDNDRIWMYYWCQRWLGISIPGVSHDLYECHAFAIDFGADGRVLRIQKLGRLRLANKRRCYENRLNNGSTHSATDRRRRL